MRGRAPGIVGARRQNKESVGLRRQHPLAAIIRPGTAVEVTERDSAPFQVEAAAFISINLDVHHHRAGLLDLADASEFYVVTEPSRDFAAGRIRAHISRGDTGQEEENA